MLSFSLSRGGHLHLQSLGNYPKVSQQEKGRIRIQMRIGLVSEGLTLNITSYNWITNVLALQISEII